MKTLKLVVVGYGGMGSYHVETILPKTEKVEVFGTYDILDNRQTAAQEKGLKTYESLAAVLADPEVDAILVATPNDSHKEIAIKAMQAGKHVVCEKPSMMNAGELEEVLAVSKETGQVFMVHQNRRWDPDYLMIRELYKNQAIGDLFQIESRVQGANGIPGDWRTEKQHGGGMLLDWGVHLFDQLLWMVDSPVQSVETDLSYILGNEVDDGFISYVKFENGVRAIVEVGTTNYVRLPRWYVKGLEGTMKIDDWDMKGKIVKATGNTDAKAPAPIQAGVGLTKTMAPPSEEATEEIAMPEAKQDFANFYDNFHDVVVNGAEPIVKNEEVLTVAKLMDDILAQGK